MLRLIMSMAHRLVVWSLWLNSEPASMVSVSEFRGHENITTLRNSTAHGPELYYQWLNRIHLSSIRICGPWFIFTTSYRLLMIRHLRCVAW
jgi:hypothetical protein